MVSYIWDNPAKTNFFIEDRGRACRIFAILVEFGCHVKLEINWPYRHSFCTAKSNIASPPHQWFAMLVCKSQDLPRHRKVEIPGYNFRHGVVYKDTKLINFCYIALNQEAVWFLSVEKAEPEQTVTS